MLTVTGLAKTFAAADGAVKAVDGVSFAVPEAQCYALLGPSGCGKTTILRCVAGLERAERGVIAIGAGVVSDAVEGVFVPVHERSIGMVFQSYAIWPHLDVFGNVAYPLVVARPRLPGSPPSPLSRTRQRRLRGRSADRHASGGPGRFLPVLTRFLVHRTVALAATVSVRTCDAGAPEECT